MAGMTERGRHELHSRLIETIGDDAAETLMSHLPPTGWADVATVHQLHQLGDQLRAEMSELRVEMGELRVELHDGLRRQTYAMVGAMVTISGVVAAAASLG